MSFKRKLFILTILSLWIVLNFSMASFAEETARGVVIANDVNIRSSPSIESSIISTLKLGEYVNIVDNNDEWYSIQLTDGKLGWVYNDLIVELDPNIDLIRKGMISEDIINVREEPNQNSTILANLNKGDEITIIEQSAEWSKIAITDEIVGWVNTEHIVVRPDYSTGQITGNNVNLRTTPVTGEVILRLDKNTYVAVKDFKEGWYNVITADDKEGWMHQDFVTIVFDKNSSREISRNLATRSATLLTIVDYAKKYIGTPYKWASSGPSSFDCSGFTSFIFKQFGIKLLRTSVTQSKTGEELTKENLGMGDLVFFDTSGVNNGKISHVGIYIGDGEFIHASSGKNARKVIISDLNEGYYERTYVTARSIF